MTGPTSGFPDWQQYASWRGQMLLDAAPNIGANQAFGLGSYAMGNYASVRVRITSSVGRTDIYLYGTDDTSGGGKHLIKRWVASTDTSIHCVIPIPTTYIQIEGFSATVGGWQGTVSVQPVNVATDKVHYYGFNSLTVVEGANINPGATIVTYPVVLLPGPAHFWGFCSNSPADVIYTAWTYDRDGVNDKRLGQWRSFPAIGLNTDFELTEHSWRMEVFNNTAINQIYFFSVASRANLT
jgi:hypothetical protein